LVSDTRMLFNSLVALTALSGWEQSSSQHMPISE
jgi:hypothetical protein